MKVYTVKDLETFEIDEHGRLICSFCWNIPKQSDTQKLNIKKQGVK